MAEIRRYNKMKKAECIVKAVLLDLERPLLLFEIGKDHVTFSNKGWLCDHVEDYKNWAIRVDKAVKSNKQIPMRWSCSYRPDQECYHIKACKNYLKKIAERLGLDISRVSLPDSESSPVNHQIHQGSTPLNGEIGDSQD